MEFYSVEYFKKDLEKFRDKDSYFIGTTMGIVSSDSESDDTKIKFLGNLIDAYKDLIMKDV